MQRRDASGHSLRPGAFAFLGGTPRARALPSRAMHARLLLVAFAVVAAACGKPTMKSLCAESAQVGCDKLFECTPSQASQLGFSSAADCKTKLDTQLNCAQYDSVTCDGVDLQKYQQCLDDTRGLACPATTQPASCTSLGGAPSCTSSDGKIICTGGSASASGTGCTTARDGCGDGHTYEVSCTGGTCECRVDGVASKTFSGTSCPSASAELNTACGWNLR